MPRPRKIKEVVPVESSEPVPVEPLPKLKKIKPKPLHIVFALMLNTGTITGDLLSRLNGEKLGIYIGSASGELAYIDPSKFNCIRYFQGLSKVQLNKAIQEMREQYEDGRYYKISTSVLKPKEESTESTSDTDLDAFELKRDEFLKLLKD